MRTLNTSSPRNRFTFQRSSGSLAENCTYPYSSRVRTPSAGRAEREAGPGGEPARHQKGTPLFFFIALSSLLLSLELSDAQVYEPYIRALLGTASHFCKEVVLQLRTVHIGTARELEL